MATTEILETWLSAVERTQLASASLKASIKLFQSGGPDAQAAWEAIEEARTAYVAANRREGICWRKVTAEPEQTEMPGVEAPGPSGPRAFPNTTLALPPGNAVDAPAAGGE